NQGGWPGQGGWGGGQGDWGKGKGKGGGGGYQKQAPADADGNWRGGAAASGAGGAVGAGASADDGDSRGAAGLNAGPARGFGGFNAGPNAGFNAPQNFNAGGGSNVNGGSNFNGGAGFNGGSNFNGGAGRDRFNRTGDGAVGSIGAGLPAAAAPGDRFLARAAASGFPGVADELADEWRANEGASRFGSGQAAPIQSFPGVQPGEAMSSPFPLPYPVLVQATVLDENANKELSIKVRQLLMAYEASQVSEDLIKAYNAFEASLNAGEGICDTPVLTLLLVSLTRVNKLATCHKVLDAAVAEKIFLDANAVIA
ncbi:unnamed protein product, partial [Polarella glacialis]